MKSNLFMRKIRNFLCFFICSFHLNCPTTEEQITDRQVLLGVTQKVSSNSKHTLLCLCGHNVLERIKPNTIENTSVVSVSLLASIYIEDCLDINELKAISDWFCMIEDNNAEQEEHIINI